MISLFTVSFDRNHLNFELLHHFPTRQSWLNFETFTTSCFCADLWPQCAWTLNTPCCAGQSIRQTPIMGSTWARLLSRLVCPLAASRMPPCLPGKTEILFKLRSPMVLRERGCYHSSSAPWQRPECHPACQVKQSFLVKLWARKKVLRGCGCYHGQRQHSEWYPACQVKKKTEILFKNFYELEWFYAGAAVITARLPPGSVQNATLLAR